MRLNAIPIGKNPPEEINVVIEVPIGGEPIKYELEKASGALFVDRFLYTPMRYPGNYGFIPHTLSGDGDPADVIVANTRAILAVEILCAAQAVDLAKPARLGAGTRAAHDAVRESVAVLERDRLLARDIEAVLALERRGTILDAVEKSIGPLG